jgi:hypothetical protein
MSVRELMPVIQTGAPPAVSAAKRARLVHRTRALAWVGLLVGLGANAVLG